MITITFNPQNADQVQILAWDMTKLLEPAADEPVAKEEAPAKKTKAQKAAPAAETKPEPETPAVAESAPTVTLEEVRAKLVAYKEKGKSLKDLFETVGCANLSAVPPERYAELLGNMEAA
jgi:hypothetical protein